MKRLPLMCVLAVLSCTAFAALAAAANGRPVMSGAMDICKAVDGGTTSVTDGIEACCAQEVTEYDNGHIEFGDQYCVACLQGTDNCTLYENMSRVPPMQQVKKALSVKPKQATITGN